MSDTGEPFLEGILRSMRNEDTGWLLSLAQRLYPLQKHQLEWQEKIYARALILSTVSVERSVVRKQSDRLFSARRLRADAGAYAEGDDNMTGLAPAGHDLQTMLPGSLLPALLDLARQEKIRLVFFRVKRKPQDDGTPHVESGYLQAYMAALEDHLRTAGVTFIDETTDPEIGRDFYGGDDHLREDRMADYTRLFWEKHGAAITAGESGGKDVAP